MPHKYTRNNNLLNIEPTSNIPDIPTSSTSISRISLSQMPCLEQTSASLSSVIRSKAMLSLLFPVTKELKLSRNVILCLPLLLVPSILPVRDKNSSPLNLSLPVIKTASVSTTMPHKYMRNHNSLNRCTHNGFIQTAKANVMSDCLNFYVKGNYPRQGGAHCLICITISTYMHVICMLITHQLS